MSKKTAAESLFKVHFNSEFEKRKLKNSRYSLRSFAGFLDMPLTTVAALLGGGSFPSQSSLKRIGRRFEWEKAQISKMQENLNQVRVAKKKSEKIVRVRPQSHLLSSLHHLGLLNLAVYWQLPNSPKKIAQLLNYSEEQVKKSIAVLLEAGFIFIENGSIKINDKPSWFSDDPIGPILAHYHQLLLSHLEHQMKKCEGKDYDVCTFLMPADESDRKLFLKQMTRLADTFKKRSKVRKASELYYSATFLIPVRKRD